VTFILVHHPRKRREGYAGDFDPVELSEIAWSGFQEWARQWLLIGRREPYAPGTGTHRLWLTAGGSVGHSSLWALDIEEGLYPDRCWDVRCLHPDEAYAEDADRTRARDEKTSQLRDRKRLDDDVARLVDAAMRYPGGETATRLRDASGLQDARFKKALAEAIDAGHVESCEVKKTNRRAPYEGYKPVAQ